MSQRTLVAAVVGGLVAFGLGYVFYVLALADFFAANGWQVMETPTLWAIAAGEIVLGYLMAYIFSTWASISTPAGGAKAGALIAALMTLGVSLIIFGAQGEITLVGVFADTVVTAVRWAVAGAAIGMVLGRA